MTQRRRRSSRKPGRSKMQFKNGEYTSLVVEYSRMKMKQVLKYLKRVAILVVALMGASESVRAEDAKASLSAWLNAQTNIQTWSADFKQTRTLKALTQPLVATGKVWFSAPNLFRWELGQPAQTLAVRQPDQMMLIYPNLKRVERFALGGKAEGPWKDALALLEAGFPRSREELESKFTILSLTESNGIGQVTLQPKSSLARKMMPQIRIEFSVSDHSLKGTELTFADGSTMRNDFSNSQLNPTLGPEVFKPEIDPAYKVVEPGKQK
jgi:outer membrane lipoprotein-sorting protein